MSIETAAVRGVAVHYGARTTSGKYGRDGVDNGLVKTAEWTYSYDDLPAAAAYELEKKLPAYAKVRRVYTEILTTVTLGGDRTGITVQGVVGDVDTGADAAAALVRGALIDHQALSTADVGSAAAELVVTTAATGGTTGTLTAGKFRTVVEYVVEKVGN